MPVGDNNCWRYKTALNSLFVLDGPNCDPKYQQFLLLRECATLAVTFKSAIRPGENETAMKSM